MISSIFDDGGNAMLLRFSRPPAAARSHPARTESPACRAASTMIFVHVGLSLNAVPIVTIDCGGGTFLAYNGLDDSLSDAAASPRIRPLDRGSARSAAAMDHRDLRADPAVAAARPSPVHQFPEHRQPAGTGTTSPPPANAGRQGLAQARRASAARQGTADHPQRAEEGARERESNLRRELDQIGDDRRKLNRQLIDVAARVRTIEQQIAAGEQRLPPLDEKEADLARVARRAPPRHRQCAGGAATHRPQSAARDAGDAGGRPAIGAFGDPVRRGAAGDAQGRRGARQRPRGAGVGAQGDRDRARQSRKEPRAPWPTTLRSSRS